MTSIEIIKNEPECEQLWKLFNPSPDFWNLWEVRKCFHSGRYQLHFIKLMDTSRAVGVLPLVFDSEWECYSYFGGYYPENNKILLSDRRYGNELIANVPSQTELYYLNEEDAKLNVQIKKSDRHYFLTLEGCNCFDDFLSRFSKKHRKNLRYDLKNIEGLNPVIERNNATDFEKLIHFNQHRFGKDSDYHDATILQEMRSLFGFVHKKGMLDLIGVSIGDSLVGVAFGIVYKDTYYSINTGRDVSIKNLGKFLVSMQIQAALEKGCKRIDFLTGDDPWKDLWNFEWEETYELIT